MFAAHLGSISWLGKLSRSHGFWGRVKMGLIRFRLKILVPHIKVPQRASMIDEAMCYLRSPGLQLRSHHYRLVGEPSRDCNSQPLSPSSWCQWIDVLSPNCRFGSHVNVIVSDS
jgi:hypothetical protein